MVERPIKRLRRLSTDEDDGERSDDWIPQKQGQGTADDDSPANTTMSRPRRTAAPATAVATSFPTTPTVTVSRPNSHSPDDSTKKSIRLTVKMPPTKLREATSGRTATVGVNSRDAFEPGQRMLGSRRGSRKRYYADESESDDDEDEEEDDIIPSEENDEEEDEAEEDEEDGEEEEEEDEEEEDVGGDEDVDAEGDVEMEDAPVPAPPPLVFKATTGSRPSVTVTPADDGKVKSVEAKEMEMEEDDDEELSELESDEEGEEEVGGVGEGDAEGDAEEEAQEEDENDEGEGSDNETPATGSRASTPDVSKMTKRQRSRLDQVMGGDFLQLPMEPQTKKHLTAEEHAMRRAEMARRRKNLSEKRNEEEKMDTINKLLKKQAPKRRGKDPTLIPTSTGSISVGGGGGGGGGENNATPHSHHEGDSFEKANAAYVRWVSGKEGCRVGVPEEWLGTPVGRVFEFGKLGEDGLGRGKRVVEEV